MPKSTEIAKTQIVKSDGVVTATVVDKVGTARLYLMLVRGAAAARMTGGEDGTPLLSPALRDHVVYPLTEV